MLYNILIDFLLWNILVFFLYGIDKYRARNGKWRIKETVLISSAYFFASLGAAFGMIVFNHKTSKTKFRIHIPFSFIINVMLIYYLFTSSKL